MTYFLRTAFIATLLSLTACSSNMAYNALESVTGIPKREMMVHHVAKARDTQEETKEQFKTALEKFTAVTNFDGGDLEAVYHELNDEYEASVKQSKKIGKRINTVKNVSDALFTEWEKEIEEYSSPSLQRSSRSQLSETQRQYTQLINAMEAAESKVQPVLAVFKDQVMYLKHNLNARAISSLKSELGGIQSDVSALIESMESSIDEANSFINSMEKQSK